MRNIKLKFVKNELFFFPISSIIITLLFIGRSGYIKILISHYTYNIYIINKINFPTLFGRGPYQGMCYLYDF